MHSQSTPPEPRSNESPGEGSTKDEAAAFASQFPQLSFQFVNYGSIRTGVDNVVYIAANTTANRIDLQIMLNTGSSILVAGDVLPPAQLPPSGQQTLLYLDLSPLQLTSDAWKLLKPAADGWSCVVYADDQVIGMAPSRGGTTLVAGTPIAVHIEGLELDRAPPSQTPQLAVTYFNVPGVTSGNTSWTSNFSVAVQNPPSGKADLTRVLAVSLVSNLVVNSSGAAREVKNKLTLQFSQTPENIGVLAGPDTLFTVSFVYGKAGDTLGYGALTDVLSAQNIVVVHGDNTGQWVPTADTGAESPYWTLKPPEGKPIAGSGAAAVVSWDFTSIVTSYQPGPTVMLVQYQNIPGYKDGVYTLVIDKIPHVVIRSLSVSPSPTYLQNHQAKVTVTWEVDYATSLELIQNYAHCDVTGETSYHATLTAQTTAFSLRATGPGADVDNVDLANVQAIALPVINSFVGAPTEIYAGSSAHDIRLNWAVDTTGNVKLGSTSGEVSGGGCAVDHSSATVDKPQMITLTPVTDPGVTAPARNLVISAFEPAVKSYAAEAATSSAAASPSAPFLALVDSAGNRVIAVDTVQFSAITTIPVGRSPSAVIFSQDGSLMVTLNGDATVSLHRIVISGGVPSFTALGSVSLRGKPQAAVITPDADRIYLTLDGKPGRLAALTKGAKGYALGQQVVVGNAPRGLAADPSGARLYVADSADDSISIVGIGIDGSLKVTELAQGVSGQPTGLAVTPDGSTLLAACPQGGVVWAIDAQNPSTGQRRQLTVGSSPVAIAVTPSGAYAFVANAGDGTVSLLDVWNGPLSCAVLQKSILVGTTPSGVAVSPDGLVVLVSDAGSQKFGVISLQTYELATVSTQVGRQPTDVVVSPDGKAALIWNNALLGAPQPVPGARYYPVASGVATQILSSVPMVECVFAPPPTDGSTSVTAYAIGSMEPTLYVLDLSDPMNAQQTEVPLPILGRTLGLALSSDGQTLFVVLVDRSHQYTLLIGSTAGGNWNAAQSLPLYTGGQFPGAVRMAVTPDGAKLFIADLRSHAFNVAVRGAGGQYALNAPAIAIPGAVNVAVLPDGSKAYVLGASSPNTITVFDVATLQTESVSVMQSYVNLQELVPSPDGRRLYAPDESAGALRILDPSSLRILQTLPLAEDISQARGASGAAISPDASRIFVANSGSETMSVLRQISMAGNVAAAPTRAELMSAATYTGTFIRQALGQVPNTLSDGSCSCPDIIFHGQTDAGDPRQFATPDSYAQMSPADVNFNQPNFVYLRGFLANTGNGSNLFFYHVTSDLMLWPQNWSGDDVQVGSSAQPQNWAWAPPVDGSSVVVTSEALVWTPQNIDINVAHYCTIVWADNSTQDEPIPPDFSVIGHFQSCDELMYFLATHPNMGWRNTTDHTTPPPDSQYTTYLSTQDNPETLNVTVFFSNIADGTFMVNVTGDVTFSSGPTPLAVSNYLGGYPVNGPDGLQFGPHQRALLIITYQTGPTPLGEFASIHARVQHPVSWMMVEKLAALAARPGVVLPISYMVVRRGGKLAISRVFLLGQQIWNLKFGRADTIESDVGSTRVGEKASGIGIVVRQALGTPPATSPAAWMYSPDLLPFTSALRDTALLTARYDTGFVQAPIPQQGNTLYVRGKNTGATAQTTTVYLYSVQHNPLAGKFSDLLYPQRWDSSVFTVDGTAGNAVTLTAANAGDVVLGAYPLVWTPDAQESETSEYVLLAWIDPGGQPPPDFTKMKPFPTLDSLRQYVEGHGNLVVLDTAYSGMFARQNGSQGPRISGADTSWSSSPDLILYSGKEAYDTALLEDALTWSVHQPPAAGGLNYLYIRGFNASAGSLNARVAFFYAVNDPTAAKNPLLDPSTWKSDAMTYSGTAQNYVTIASNATGDFMLNDTPLVWQPAAPPSGTTYALIAWIDDTNGSNPPPFASLPAFGSLDALADYVRGVRNLVLWDGSYDGLFVRQFPGQTAAQAGTGALMSPDIILAGTAAAQDASAFTAASSYTPGTVSNAATTGVPNFVYIRAINPNNRAQRARVYLFLGDEAKPSFGALSNSGFTVGGKTQNWVDLEADTQNEVLISTVPIVWIPPPPATPQSQQFLLTYVDGSATPQPPDFSAVGYTQFDAIETFVATQPQLSWVRVINTLPDPKPTFTAQYPQPPTAVTTAGRYLVGLQFVNIPIDGSVTLSIPGPDAANTIVVPSFHPSTPNAAVVWTATYPAGFPLSAVVSYWQGSTAAPTGATVQFLMVPYPT